MSPKKTAPARAVSVAPSNRGESRIIDSLKELNLEGHSLGDFCKEDLYDVAKALENSSLQGDEAEVGDFLKAFIPKVILLEDIIEKGHDKVDAARRGDDSALKAVKFYYKVCGDAIDIFESAAANKVKLKFVHE